MNLKLRRDELLKRARHSVKVAEAFLGEEVKAVFRNDRIIEDWYKRLGIIAMNRAENDKTAAWKIQLLL